MKIFIAIFLVLSILVQTGEALAYEIPQFTSCVNPQGIIKASYETGTHGIAGRSGSFTGKDTVYTISSSSLTQCFCAADGAGIQTNWWKIPALSEPEINILKSLGWIYVPNGALWGLENAPFLALNSDYSCKASSGGGPGSVLGAAAGGVGQVLGLASSGNTIFLLVTSAISGLSLILGLIFKKRAKKFSNLNNWGNFLLVFGFLTAFVLGYLMYQRYNPQNLSFAVSKIESDSSNQSDLRPVGLKINSINLALAVSPAEIKNNTWEASITGVSYLKSSALPGEKGNAILYGHNWPNLLANLKNTKPGDEITVIYNDNSSKNFEVEYLAKVSPNETSILENSQDSRITLYTCTGFLDTQRLVVVAKLNNNPPTGGNNLTI